MNRIARVAVGSVAVMSAVGSAQAASIITNDPANPYTYVVHNDGAGSGNVLELVTKPGDYKVIFSSDSTIDAGNGNGVATVDGPFVNLTIDPSNPIVGFTAIQFKLDQPTGRPVVRDFDVTVNFLVGGPRPSRMSISPATTSSIFWRTAAR